MSDERPAGTIYDLGYQRYAGPRLGRANAVRTLIAFSFRAAFGVGRGGRARTAPLALTALILLPALVQVGIATASGRREFIDYPQYLVSIALFLALFTASQAPELVVTDRQHGVLSLYLSRSLRGIDYALSKLAALVCALFVLLIVPLLLLFFGGVFLSSAPWPAFTGSWRILGPIVGVSLALACYLGSTGLALAALSARRAYASASVIAFFLLLPAGASIARSMLEGEGRRYAALGNPFSVMTGFAYWIFDAQPPVRGRGPVIATPALPGPAYLYVLLATCAIAVVVLMLRYRKAEA